MFECWVKWFSIGVTFRKFQVLVLCLYRERVFLSISHFIHLIWNVQTACKSVLENNKAQYIKLYLFLQKSSCSFSEYIFLFLKFLSSCLCCLALSGQELSANRMTFLHPLRAGRPTDWCSTKLSGARGTFEFITKFTVNAGGGGGGISLPKFSRGIPIFHKTRWETPV
jgi:hypothetical protein